MEDETKSHLYLILGIIGIIVFSIVIALLIVLCERCRRRRKFRPGITSRDSGAPMPMMLSPIKTPPGSKKGTRGSDEWTNLVFANRGLFIKNTYSDFSLDNKSKSEPLLSQPQRPIVSMPNLLDPELNANDCDEDEETEQYLSVQIAAIMRSFPNLKYMESEESLELRNSLQSLQNLQKELNLKRQDSRSETKLLDLSDFKDKDASPYKSVGVSYRNREEKVVILDETEGKKAENVNFKGEFSHFKINKEDVIFGDTVDNKQLEKQAENAENRDFNGEFSHYKDQKKSMIYGDTVDDKPLDKPLSVHLNKHLDFNTEDAEESPYKYKKVPLNEKQLDFNDNDGEDSPYKSFKGLRAEIAENTQVVTVQVENVPKSQPEIQPKIQPRNHVKREPEREPESSLTNGLETQAKNQPANGVKSQPVNRTEKQPATLPENGHQSQPGNTPIQSTDLSRLFKYIVSDNNSTNNDDCSEQTANSVKTKDEDKDLKDPKLLKDSNIPKGKVHKYKVQVEGHNFKLIDEEEDEGPETQVDDSMEDLIDHCDLKNKEDLNEDCSSHNSDSTLLETTL